MQYSFNGCYIHCLRNTFQHYLSNQILPSKFESAQQPEQNTIQICFRGINNINWIEFSWQGDCARVLSIKRPERIGTNSTLAQQLNYGLKYMAFYFCNDKET